MNNWEIKILKAPFAIAPRNTQYSGINLTKYCMIYMLKTIKKTLMREIKEGLIGGIYCVHGTEESILQFSGKLIYRF